MISAESTENSGLRASSDYSLLPKYAASQAQSFLKLFCSRNIYDGESDYREYPSDRPDEIEEGKIFEKREHEINPNESYSAHKYKRRYRRNKRFSKPSQRRAEDIVDSADEISA